VDEIPGLRLNRQARQTLIAFDGGILEIPRAGQVARWLPFVFKHERTPLKKSPRDQVRTKPGKLRIFLQGGLQGLISQNGIDFHVTQHSAIAVIGYSDDTPEEE